MYMRVTRARVDPSKLDEAVGQLAADLRAAISRLPGYQSYTLTVDRAGGQALSVSTWDTEEHARWSREVLGDIPSRLQALGMQIDPPEFFEETTPTRERSAMYVTRVTRARMDPARFDEVSQLMGDLAVASRQLPGYQNVVMGSDRASGRIVVISTWDSEEHARWFRDDIGDTPKLQALGVQVDEPEFFEETSPT